MKKILAAIFIFTSMPSLAMESGSTRRNGKEKQSSPISLFAMTSLPGQIPEDLRDSVCGFDLDGTLTEPSAEDFKRRVPVEAGTPKVLKELAVRGCTVIIITARVPGQRTVDELNEGGYDFFTMHDFYRPFGFINKILFKAEHGNVEYRDGILFASNVNKGTAALALFTSPDANTSGKMPKNFIYVDDAVSESRNVIEAMEGFGVRSYVFRYMAPDREHFDY